jgi:Fic family protein
MKEYHPIFDYTDEIVQSIEQLAKMQGELQGFRRSIQNELSIHSLANIDAVHYSTKIEGNLLTLQQVTQALAGQLKKSQVKHHRDLKEILNYAKARSFLFQRAENHSRLDIELILKIHQILLQGIVAGKLKGFLRTDQNVIRNADSNSIVYFPPDYHDVKSLLLSLLEFVNRAPLAGLSILIAAAVFHYRLVTIHPFMDGNGRVARLITNYILAVHDFDILKYASIEKQHEKDRAEYYLRLRELQGSNFYEIPEKINLTPWIQYWLTCLKSTCHEALERVKIIEPETQDTLALNKRLQKAVHLFKKHVRLSAGEYQTLLGMGRTQAVADLNELLKKGLIKKIGGGRSTVYNLK